jgi:hypothetical protein
MLCADAAVAALAQQVQTLTLAFAEQQQLIKEQQQTVTEQQRIIKRVVFQPPVEIRSFNGSGRFYSPPYRSLGELFVHTFKELKLEADTCPQARFYWLPSGDLSTADRIAQRKTIRSEAAWEAFLDNWNVQEHGGSAPITLNFVMGEVSPSLFERPTPPSPPRLPAADAEECKSEPESVRGLAERDGGECFLCGHSHPEAAHVVDNSRAELLEGAPDAPDVDDVRNHLQLCPNHHASFDRHEWTLVEVRQEAVGAAADDGSAASSSGEGNGDSSSAFYVRATPAAPLPTPDIVCHMQTAYRFSSASRAPPAYAFLLKQLGRFKVLCRVARCGQLWPPTSLPGHYSGAHKTAEEKAQWQEMGRDGKPRMKPHLLPRPCDCAEAERGTTVWQLYCHVVSKHSEMLYV